MENLKKALSKVLNTFETIMKAYANRPAWDVTRIQSKTVMAFGCPHSCSAPLFPGECEALLNGMTRRSVPA